MNLLRHETGPSALVPGLVHLAGRLRVGPVWDHGFVGFMATTREIVARRHPLSPDGRAQ